MSRAHQVRSAALPAGLLGALLLVLLLGVVLDRVLLVAVGGIGVHVSELVLHRRLGRALPRQLPLVLGERHVRLLLEDALVVCFLLRSDGVPDLARGLAVIALVVHQLLRVAHTLLRLADDRLRARRAELRNLPSAVPALPPRSVLAGEAGALVLGHAGVLLPFALVLGSSTGSYGVLAPAAVAVVVVAACVVLAVVPRVAALARLPRGQRLVQLAQDAVLQVQPTVVLYSPGGPDSYHWVRPWLDTLEHLGQPSLILLRQPLALDALGPTSIPVLCLPQSADVATLALPAPCVALFVANAEGNLPLLKQMTLKSAFIGHGDSDKASSASPASKVYDEVWVAGESGRQRYLESRVGVRPEQIRVVGRPQVRRVQPAQARRPGQRFTVLYAPTWEGTGGSATASSLLHSGRAVVTTLLSCEDVRVLYRPHPATGNGQRSYARASREIEAMVARAGAPHAVTPPLSTDLYDCFNTADALIADLSGVISDFLASDKPYFVVNGSGLSDEDFRERNPSTGGAYLVGSGGDGLQAALDDARGPDTLRERRREVRTWLIGPPTSDPVRVFADALDALVHQE